MIIKRDGYCLYGNSVHNQQLKICTHHFILRIEFRALMNCYFHIQKCPQVCINQNKFDWNFRDKSIL